MSGHFDERASGDLSMLNSRDSVNENQILLYKLGSISFVYVLPPVYPVLPPVDLPEVDLRFLKLRIWRIVHPIS